MRQLYKLAAVTLFIGIQIAGAQSYAGKGGGKGGGKPSRGTTTTPTVTAAKSCTVQVTSYYKADGTLAGTVDVQAYEKTYCKIENGDLYCWGRNDRGQVGNSDTGTCEVVPATAPFKTLSGGVTAVSTDSLTDKTTSYAHTCAIQYGNVYCWGENKYGELGNDNEPGSVLLNRSTPKLASAFVSNYAVSAIRTQWLYTCATIQGLEVCRGIDIVN